ncbi:MAG: response regulator [Candidatus Moranbacteria bacterium]|nr:response regulator [Candidatus Moranbacteria bacterium]
MQKRVLIIDDDQDLLEMYGLKFLQEGFSVERAENGAWGLKRIKEEPFDIVLLDVSMPAMNGLEMLKNIKGKNKIEKSPKIIALSNTALDAEIEEMKKAGADKCFIKIRMTPAEIYQEALKLLREK